VNPYLLDRWIFTRAKVVVSESRDARDRVVDLLRAEEPGRSRVRRRVSGTSALGYSRWFGVTGSSGVQLGSPTVSSLPSVSPAGIAVAGRQKA
jgi:hypothetical protein